MSHSEPIGRHVHTNWAFSAVGEYTLTFEATGTTIDGFELSTGPVDFNWIVGPAPTWIDLSVTPEAPSVGDVVTLAARVGADAVPESGNAPGGVVSFRAGDVVIGEAPIEGGMASLATTDLAEGPTRSLRRTCPTA